MKQIICIFYLIYSVQGIGLPEKDIRMMHGYVCPVTSHPYAIAIFHRDQPKLFLCNGGLIRYDWVISTASCIKSVPLTPKKFWLSCGCTELYVNGTQTQEVEKIYVHPHFVDGTYAENDIAAIRTKKNFVPQSDCFPIDLLPPCQPDRLCESLDKYCLHATAMSFGWNCRKGLCETYTGELLCMKVWPIPTKECSAKKRDHIPIPKTVFCALSEGEYTCKLDRGGPVVCNNKMIGLIARRDECLYRGDTFEYFTQLNRVMDFLINVTFENDDKSGVSCFGTTVLATIFVTIVSFFIYNQM